MISDGYKLFRRSIDSFRLIEGENALHIDILVSVIDVELPYIYGDSTM